MFDHRPLISVNVAMTADGKTDTAARQSATISSPRDWERVDRLRAESDAVMVGGRTLLGDDPRLTVKSETLRAQRRARGLDENPIKVGVVTNASLRPDSRFLTAGPARVMLFTTEQTSSMHIAQLHERGAEVYVLGATRVDLAGALRTLRIRGVERLLVEGGGTLIAALLRLKVVDEIFLYIAPLIFGGIDAPTWVAGAGLEQGEAIRLQLRTVEHWEDGSILVHYIIV